MNFSPFEEVKLQFLSILTLQNYIFGNFDNLKIQQILFRNRLLRFGSLRVQT